MVMLLLLPRMSTSAILLRTESMHDVLPQIYTPVAPNRRVERADGGH